MGARFKVLMTGKQSTVVEAEMLKDKGFMVYTCETHNAPDMIDEVHPDVIYVNSGGTDTDTALLYKSIAHREISTDIPMIITLLEDDTYLLEKKHAITRKIRHILCDNLFDAIKMSLTGIERKSAGILANSFGTTAFARR